MSGRMRLLMVCLLAATDISAQERTAVLGRCELELGGVIEDCRVAYRTFGARSPDGRNAILIPTWFASGSGPWVSLLGPAGVVDTAGVFIVVVESLGAGASSSPANSVRHAGTRFPSVTIGDMVEASYRLSREHLGLPELYAVVGISMGGQQALEWGVTHPDYVRRIVSVAAGPRQAYYGRAFWELVAATARAGITGALADDSVAYALARLMVLGTTSPAAANQRSGAYSVYLSREAHQLREVDLHEWLLHADAILRHDISREFGGNTAEAARRWRARTLIVTSELDHSIDPQPAQEFARLIGADTLVIRSPAGHTAIFSDSTAKAYVREFLKK